MPGDTWQEFANLRLLLAYQFVSPGKKLNFMGNELAQGREWRASWELDWGAARRALAPGCAAAGARPQPPAPRSAGAARPGLHPRGLQLDRLPRRRPLHHQLRAPGAQRRFRRCRAQLHAGAARELPHRPARRRALRARCSTATRPTTAAATSAMPEASKRRPCPGWGWASRPRSRCLRWPRWCSSRSTADGRGQASGPVRDFRGRPAGQDRRAGRRERLAAHRADVPGRGRARADARLSGGDGGRQVEGPAGVTARAGRVARQSAPGRQAAGRGAAPDRRLPAALRASRADRIRTPAGKDWPDNELRFGLLSYLAAILASAHSPDQLAAAGAALPRLAGRAGRRRTCISCRATRPAV